MCETVQNQKSCRHCSPQKVRTHKIFILPFSNNHHSGYIFQRREDRSTSLVQFIPGKEGKIGMGSVPSGLERKEERLGGVVE